MASVLLIAVRLIQGAAFANQLGLGWVYVTECLTKERLAINLSLVCASFVLGGFTCGLLNTLLNHMFTPERMMAYAWRIPFIVSGLMGLLGYFLIKRLNETKAFLRLQKHPISNPETHSLSTQRFDLGFSRTHSIIMTAFLYLLYASIMILFFWLLPKLIDRQINIAAQTLRIVGIMGVVIGMVFYGWLASKLNVGLALIIGAALLYIQAIMFQYTLSVLVSRYRNEQRFHFYSLFVGLAISALVIMLHWIVTGGLPRFLLPMFKDNFLAPLVVPVLSTAMLAVVILLICAIFSKRLADRYNNQYFSYHK